MPVEIPPDQVDAQIQNACVIYWLPVDRVCKVVPMGKSRGNTDALQNCFLSTLLKSKQSARLLTLFNYDNRNE